MGEIPQNINELLHETRYTSTCVYDGHLQTLDRSYFLLQGYLQDLNESLLPSNPCSYIPVAQCSLLQKPFKDVVLLTYPQSLQDRVRDIIHEQGYNIVHTFARYTPQDPN